MSESPCHTAYVLAFEAVLGIGADLVLHDGDRPGDHLGAEAALRSWAAGHGFVVESREFEPGDVWAACLSVATGQRGTVSHRSIDVYVRSRR